MATIYEGTQREQDQVDERIDPEILRALGLDDVVDLDYSEYKTLLKERLAANRMNTSQKAREDSAELDEKILKEFKRVKAETGRFKVRNERVSYQKMLPGTANGGGGGLVQNITFQPQSAQEQEEGTPQVDGLNDFLTGVVAPSLSRIESSLLSILENLTGQQKAEEKAASQARIAGEKAKKRAKENRFEGLGDMAKKAMNVAKKVFSPLSQIFGAIFNFLSNVLTGFLVLKVLDWIKNPQHLFIDIGNLFIMFLNTLLRVAGEIAFFPFNLMIDGLNNGLNMFEEAINNSIGKIPGVPKLELPEIPRMFIPEFPLIPYPKQKQQGPNQPKMKTPKVPAMAEGGPVTNIYNIMSDGGQVRTDTGERVTGAGPDTQLVALQPGEFVMSKGAVDTFGVDTMMDMNAAGGGNNMPRMARVQRVGNVMAMQGGGFMGSDNVVDTGLKDGKGRAVKLAPDAGAAFHQMIKDGMPYNPSDVANVYRDKAEYERLIRAGYSPAKNSYHNYGEGADIHGQMNSWIRENGPKYGWRVNDYKNSHKGHFEFRGKGPAPITTTATGSDTGSSEPPSTTQVQPQNTVTGKPKPTTQNKTPSRKSKDYWALVAITSVESGVAQGRADVATSIMNRAASGGVYAGSPSIHALVNAKNQYQPVRRGDPQLWAQITDKESAIAAVNSVPYAKGRGKQFIEDTMAVLSNQQMMSDAAKFVGPRTDFSTPKTMNGPNQSHAKWRSTHRSKEVSRHNHIFGFFVGPGAVELGKKRFGEGAGATSMEQMNLSGGDTGDVNPQQQSQQSGNNTQQNLRQGTPETTMNFEKPAYEGGGLPLVSTGLMDDSKPINVDIGAPSRPTPPRPPSVGGKSGDSKVPVLAASGQKTPTSTSSGSGSGAPMFSPLDTTNPDLIVVKSIYNIVG